MEHVQHLSEGAAEAAGRLGLVVSMQVPSRPTVPTATCVLESVDPFRHELIGAD